MIKDNPSIEMPYDVITPTYRFDNAFHVIFPTRQDWEEKKAIPSEGCITWFSDGSKYDNLAGSGIYCPQTEKGISFHLGHYASIFESETFGISKCTEESLGNEVRHLPIYICSDSQSALKALNSYKISSAQVLECRDQVQLLAHQAPVTLVWVPGHNDIHGNEMADKLAKA